jgi:hypothetical protein
MKPDPVLREVYRMKDQLARQVGNDVGTLFDLLREDAQKHPTRMIQPVPKPLSRNKPRALRGKRAK